MLSVHIEDKKIFTSRLFVKEVFDEFIFIEALITTFNTYTIDGRMQKKFYSEEEYREMGAPEFSKWSDVKKLCFEMIKGSRLPLKFKIILKLNEKQVEAIMEKCDTQLEKEQIQGLILNIKFENDSLDCVTATSLNVFSMDKTLEETFDKWVEKFLTAL